MGWVAALAAAYALVFQLVFASALVAGMPRDASGALICTGVSTLATDADRDGKADETAVRCAACLARADIADLPPPIPVPALVRSGAGAASVAPAHPITPRAPARLPSQPRAPPFLG